MVAISVFLCLMMALVVSNSSRVENTHWGGVIPLHSGWGIGYRWVCPFNITHCGIVNQPRMPNNFVLFPHNKLLDHSGIYYLELSVKNLQTRPGSRLITPYFEVTGPGHKWHCLNITYLLFGNAFGRLRVVQQDRFNNKNIFTTEHLITGCWNELSIQFLMKPRNPSRFFIEVCLNYQGHHTTGFFAISEISLGENCH